MLCAQVDTVVNPLKKTVSSVGNMVKSMPDNIVDGVVKVSGGIRSIPSNMLDGMGRMLSNRPPQVRSGVGRFSQESLKGRFSRGARAVCSVACRSRCGVCVCVCVCVCV